MQFTIEHIIPGQTPVIKLLRYFETNPANLDLSILSAEESALLQRFSSAKRKLEFYFTRLLWQSFGIAEPIRYKDTGRPYASSGHMSISHSGNCIVIGYQPEHFFGIDIEFISPKIRTIRSKFIAPQDEDLIDVSDDIHLALAWSIKEAVYKMEDIPGLSFREHIHVRLNNEKGYVDVVKDGNIHHYDFNFLILDKFVITYCSYGNLTGKTKHT